MIFDRVTGTASATEAPNGYSDEGPINRPKTIVNHRSRDEEGGTLVPKVRSTSRVIGLRSCVGRHVSPSDRPRIKYLEM
jgi:hypothetical protein